MSAPPGLATLENRSNASGSSKTTGGAHFRVETGAGKHVLQPGVAYASRTQRSCKICSHVADYVLSMDNDHGTPRVLDLFLCTNCGFLFVGNSISDQELAYAYGTMDSKRYYDEVAGATSQKIAAALSDLRDHFERSPSMSVLDIGCGYGLFLDALSKSYPSVRAVGQEPDEGCASACRSKGFKVFTCKLEEISEYYSLIALLDVAEHVPDPNRTFVACYERLGNDGYIYIHTPRRCFWDNFFLAVKAVPGLRRLAKAWLRTRVSIFHLQLWTDEALKLSLQKAGFEVRYLSPEMELSWPLERYGRVYLGEKLKLPPFLVKMATMVAGFLFVRLGTLKNKAICLGRKRRR